MKELTRITINSEFHGTTMLIINYQNKTSAGSHPNLAHLRSSAKKLKLSAYTMQKSAGGENNTCVLPTLPAFRNSGRTSGKVNITAKLDWLMLST